MIYSKNSTSAEIRTSVSYNSEVKSKNYFETSKPPKHLSLFKELIKNFIDAQKEKDRRIVLITSGGTSVPLESKIFPYLEYFSGGSRGAASAEYFLKNNYSVIFLCRKNTLQPFTRSLENIHFLDLLSITKDDLIQVKQSCGPFIKKLLYEYERCRVENLLLNIYFETLDEYLHLLKLCSELLNDFGEKVIFYLTAGVSDFYISFNESHEPKILQSQNNLAIKLLLEPKIPFPVVSKYASSAFIVSFNLETDPKLLVPKAKAFLKTYGHNLIIGNILETRKKEIFFIENEAVKPMIIKNFDLTRGVEIEQYIVSRVIEYHKFYIEKFEEKIDSPIISLKNFETTEFSENFQWSIDRTREKCEGDFSTSLTESIHSNKSSIHDESNQKQSVSQSIMGASITGGMSAAWSEDLFEKRLDFDDDFIENSEHESITNRDISINSSSQGVLNDFIPKTDLNYIIHSTAEKWPTGFGPIEAEQILNTTAYPWLLENLVVNDKKEIEGTKLKTGKNVVDEQSNTEDEEDDNPTEESESQ